MPYVMGSGAVDTAVSREEAWFNLASPFTGSLPLLKTAGGAFDVVQGYTRKVEQRQRGLYIVRTEMRESRLSFGGEKELRHHMIAHISWPLEYQTGRLESDEQALDTALKAVFDRIRGPIGDSTHGNRFLTAGESPEEMTAMWPDMYGERQAARAGGGGLVTATVRWVCVDAFVA